MKHLPCKKDKCLLYPACKHKEMIDCKLLRDYYKYYREERRVKAKTVWKAINITLPYAQSIVGPINKTHNAPQYYYQRNIMNPRMTILYGEEIEEEFNFDPMQNK